MKIKTIAQREEENKASKKRHEIAAKQDPRHSSNYIYPKSNPNAPDPVRECLDQGKSPVGLHSDPMVKRLDAKIWELHQFIQGLQPLREEILEKTKDGNPILFGEGHKPWDNRKYSGNNAQILAWTVGVELEMNLTQILELRRLRVLHLEQGDQDAIYGQKPPKREIPHMQHPDNRLCSHIWLFDDRLKGDWKLTDKQMKELFAVGPKRLKELKEKGFHLHRLDLERQELPEIERTRLAFQECCPRDSKETIDRMVEVFYIRYALDHLLFDRKAEYDWLTKPREEWDQRSTLDLILEGSLVELRQARQYAEYANTQAKTRKGNS